jgi:hypothetical protein
MISKAINLAVDVENIVREIDSEAIMVPKYHIIMIMTGITPRIDCIAISVRREKEKLRARSKTHLPYFPFSVKACIIHH